MWKVMNVTGLKFFTNEAKKLATVAIGISKKVVKTCFKIQFNAAVFPFIFAYGGIVYVSKWFQNSDSENTPTVQPTSAFVCGKMKQLRNSASSMIAMNSPRCHNETNAKRNDQNKSEYGKQTVNVEYEFSNLENSDRNATLAPLKINEFSGKDLLWDVKLISSKAKSLVQCIKEERDDDIVETRKALQQHDLENPMPKTRRDFNDINKTENKHENSKLSIIKLDYAETRNADNCNAKDGAGSDSFKEKYRQRKGSCLHDASIRLSPRRKTKYLCNPFLTQDKMCLELSSVNKTLGKIQTMCSKLLKEILNLNEVLTNIISMQQKLANLEFELDEGKRLLQEVEYDRFIMRSKLLALEKLINDEENFLSNLCESGFYESFETTGGS